MSTQTYAWITHDLPWTAILLELHQHQVVQSWEKDSAIWACPAEQQQEDTQILFCNSAEESCGSISGSKPVYAMDCRRIDRVSRATAVCCHSKAWRSDHFSRGPTAPITWNKSDLTLWTGISGDIYFALIFPEYNDNPSDVTRMAFARQHFIMR